MLSLILIRDGRELITQPLADEAITIGRSFDNTLQLADPTISRTHCRIELTDGKPFVTDLSRNGILVNGESTSHTALDEGDILTLGPWTAKVTAPITTLETTVVDHTRPTQVLSFDAEKKLITEEKLFVTVVSPNQNPFKRRLSQAEIIFGTHATTDVAVADQFVSRQHCRLIIKDGTLILCDLGSTNGTFVDGVRIHKTALARDGSFTIGKTHVRYTLSLAEERISPSSKAALGSLLGKSKAMREVFALIKRAAPSNVTVCVHGESGTGKELVARELHANSGRRDKPFVALNCGAIPSTIIESLLFGHERGAFTGAVERQTGVFEQANGGTLFLDEIGEMEPNLQSRLLRVLEDNSVKRLGAHEETPTDVRLVVATNRDLKALVAAGTFREDVFYRLYVLPIHLLPLRERKDDIPLLANYFVEKYAPIERTLNLSAEAMNKLIEHDWRGNVRELKNTLMRTMIMAEGTTIEPQDIQFVLAPPTAGDSEPIDHHERNAIIEALRKTKGNQTKAASLLGIARTTISYKIGRYGINPKNL